jgi:hypothetical protein
MSPEHAFSLRGGVVDVEGDLDFRGTLGVSREAPVGFTDIRVEYELETDARDEQLDRLIRSTRCYLRRSPKPGAVPEPQRVSPDRSRWITGTNGGSHLESQASSSVQR